IALSQGRLDVAPHLLAHGGIVPRVPTNAALTREARGAKTLGKRCDGLACDMRQEATHRGFGVMIGSLTWEDPHEGRHEGVEAWHDLLENLRGHLTFVQQLAVAQGVSRFHGPLLL